LKNVCPFAFTSSFALVSVAELRVFHSCVCFGFLGWAPFWALPGFWAFESGLFQLLKVNRELAFIAPCRLSMIMSHLKLYPPKMF
jgi:hypothetical protein